MRKRGKPKKVTTIDGLARLMQGEFVAVRAEIAGVRKDLGAEIAGVRKDLGAEIAGVRKDLGAEIAGVRKDLGAEIALVKYDLAEVKHDLAEVKRDVKEMKESSSELFTKLDAFISMYEAQREELAVLAKQMRRLEARVAQLEAGK